MLLITFAAMVVFGLLALYADHEHTQSRKISKVLGFARVVNIALFFISSGIAFALIVLGG